jgi:hypothetical protein
MINQCVLGYITSVFSIGHLTSLLIASLFRSCIETGQENNSGACGCTHGGKNQMHV